MNVYEFVASECARCGYTIVDGAEVSVSCVPDALGGPIAKLAADSGASVEEAEKLAFHVLGVVAEAKGLSPDSDEAISCTVGILASIDGVQKL